MTRRRSRHLDRAAEAVATWFEQLRDLMSAEHGVLGTVVATTGTCPVAIRPEVASVQSCACESSQIGLGNGPSLLVVTGRHQQERAMQPGARW